MKKIIAIILAIVTVMTLASCGKKAPDFNANTYEDRMADTVMEIDNMTYQYLGDNIIETEYKNGTYFIFLTVDGVNSSRLVSSFPLPYLLLDDYGWDQNVLDYSAEDFH